MSKFLSWKWLRTDETTWTGTCTNNPNAREIFVRHLVTPHGERHGELRWFVSGLTQSDAGRWLPGCDNMQGARREACRQERERLQLLGQAQRSKRNRASNQPEKLTTFRKYELEMMRLVEGERLIESGMPAGTDVASWLRPAKLTILANAVLANITISSAGVVSRIQLKDQNEQDLGGLSFEVLRDRIKEVLEKMPGVLT
jgi:hypothetical protein